MILNTNDKYCSNLRKNNKKERKKDKYEICHARRRFFSATCAVTVFPHIHICVSKFKQHCRFAILLHY